MADLVTQQNSLNAGELAPDLYGRQDLEKYHSGTSTCRNFFSNYRGGVSSRAGLAYVGTCKQTGANPPRDIPFQFSLNQGFVLEFGEYYMRIKSDGAYVVEGSENIIGISQTGPAIFGVASHGYSPGDWLFIQNVEGMTEFNGLTWIVDTVPDINSFTVTNLFGSPVDSSSFPGYISGGTTSRIYTVVSPYAAVDLPYLKYTQSADTMTLCCVNPNTNVEYSPYSLTRLGNTDWVFTPDTFSSDISAPVNPVAVAQSSDVVTTWYSYVITAVNDNTGEESVASLPVNVQNVDIALTLGSNTLSWDSVSGATSYKVYAATPSYSVNVPVSSLYGFVGTALGTSFTDTNITADFTQVPPVHNDPFVRGAVAQVDPTAGGSNYSQQTISYSVSSGTGTGFSGTPVVTNGSLSGFVIYNHGKGYESGDTISFSDSGGGVATGTVTFTANPADTNSMFLNGVAIHFATAPKSGPGEEFVYSEIEGNVNLTVQTLANVLNSSNVLSFSVASYTASGNVLTINYKTPGTVGNSYTMTTVSAPVTFSGATLAGGGTVGSGATATLSIGPEQNTFPSVAAYFQQRRVYANSLNNPDTYWMSQPGLFSNMDASIPTIASDSITGTPWAQQVNGIQFLVPMPGGLVVLTGKGAWQVNGGQTAAITPSNQVATPQAYNGCNGIVQPITINYDILYVQSKGSIWRDLSYNFFTNIYTGTDLTVLSNHLFTDYQMVQAAWAEEPYKLLWCVRSDGTLLCLTYLKEQEVYSWTRHDTNGLFVGVCSVTEPPVDAVYVIVKRYVQGAWRYYSERMDDRTWDNVEDSFCVDSGLSYPQRFPDAEMAPSAATGSNVLFTATAPVLDPTMFGQIIRIDGGKAQVVDYVDVSRVRCNILEPLTTLVPNDPNKMPVPAPSGEWSVSGLTQTVSGLNHLEGLTVTALADGSVVPNQVVTNGSISLIAPASKIVVGLPYTCQVQTMYIDAPTPGGTVQNRRKNISAVGVRVESTRGLQVGADQPDSAAKQNSAAPAWTDMNEIKERTQFVPAGQAVPLYTGDYYKAITSGWDVKGQIAVQQVYPLPASVLSIVSYWQDGDNK